MKFSFFSAVTKQGRPLTNKLQPKPQPTSAKAKSVLPMVSSEEYNSLFKISKLLKQIGGYEPTCNGKLPESIYEQLPKSIQEYIIQRITIASKQSGAPKGLDALRREAFNILVANLQFAKKLPVNKMPTQKLSPEMESEQVPPKPYYLKIQGYLEKLLNIK